MPARGFISNETSSKTVLVSCGNILTAKVRCEGALQLRRIDIVPSNIVKVIDSIDVVSIL